MADAFDAMTTDRPYREKVDYASAFKEIENNAGKQFDPMIVEAFGKLLKCGEIERLLEMLSTGQTDGASPSNAGIA